MNVNTKIWIYKLKQFWLNLTLASVQSMIGIISAPPTWLSKHSKFNRPWLIVPVLCAMIIIVTAGMAFPGWLFWRLFFPWLHYWHVLSFMIFSELVCIWFCWTRDLRERSRAMRIVELIVGWVLLITVIVFISFKFYNS